MRSAERVVAVLELLRRAPGPLRHGEVARELSIPKSSATNLLDTLADTGLIARDDRGYSLGVRLIELGATAAERLDLPAIARPVLHELSQLMIGTANLAVLRGHDVLYIEKITNPEQVIQVATRVGGAVPAHATALGKVLLADLPASERAAWIAAHAFTPLTDHTITSPDEFSRALQRCAEDGYATDDQEQNLRVACIAAPVRDHTGRAVAAISLTGLTVELGSDSDGAVAAVLDGARRVSATLGAAHVAA